MFELLAEKVVTNGIDALDVLKPEWLNNMPLDLSKLDFMHVDSCPLYYAYGDFLRGYNAVRDAGYYLNECGFAEPHVQVEYLRGERTMMFDVINAEWRKRIAERRTV
jgi:hypothetical protein